MTPTLLECRIILGEEELSTAQRAEVQEKRNLNRKKEMFPPVIPGFFGTCRGLVPCSSTSFWRGLGMVP
jgi:hypothetical protein